MQTYHFWRNNVSDPNELSETYSGQFYDAIRAHNLKALVISDSNSAERTVSPIGDLVFVSKHNTAKSMKGALYHLHEIRHSLWVIKEIVKFNPRLALITNMKHWWLLSLLKLWRIQIITSLHCTFWPKGTPARNLSARILNKVNGFFWRHVNDCTICISPECEAQVREISQISTRRPIFQGRAHYDRQLFLNFPDPDPKQQPFVILFCGRIEGHKGIYTLLDVANQLRTKVRTDFKFFVAGDGSEKDLFIQRVRSENLSGHVIYKGKLGRAELLELYQQAHAVFVPTTASFPEGLNKVVVEGILSKRPVVATTVCNAGDVISNGLIEVAPGDVSAMTNILARLISDNHFYQQACLGISASAIQFYDRDASWRRAFESALAVCTMQNKWFHS
ncbi:MAG: glycosyltransferase family 4 protein [Thiobacillus sp.]|nr:glycosyltransferase family 4 protein [Thiobacillus sp.]